MYFTITWFIIIVYFWFIICFPYLTANLNSNNPIYFEGRPVNNTFLVQLLAGAVTNYFVRCKEGSWLIFRTEQDDLLGLSSYVLLYSKTRACSIYSAHLTYYDYFACLVREWFKQTINAITLSAWSSTAFTRGFLGFL